MGINHASVRPGMILQVGLIFEVTSAKGLTGSFLPLSMVGVSWQIFFLGDRHRLPGREIWTEKEVVVFILFWNVYPALKMEGNDPIRRTYFFQLATEMTPTRKKTVSNEMNCFSSQLPPDFVCTCIPPCPLFDFQVVPGFATGKLQTNYKM